MKKILVFLLLCFTCIATYSQNYRDSDYYYYENIENSKEYGISAGQKAKIIEIKKSIGLRHAAIGKDRSIRGAAKGEAHRKLNKQIRKEIDEVLNISQRGKWHDDRTKDNKWKDDYYGWDDNRKIKKQLDALDDKIDDIEDHYEDKIDKVEDDKSLTKTERKALIKSLKQEMKAKKEELKDQKEKLKKERI